MHPVQVLQNAPGLRGKGVPGGVFHEVEDLVRVHLPPPPLVQLAGRLHEGPAGAEGEGEGHLASLHHGLRHHLPLLLPEEGGQGLEDLGGEGLPKLLLPDEAELQGQSPQGGAGVLPVLALHQLLHLLQGEVAQADQVLPEVGAGLGAGVEDPPPEEVDAPVDPAPEAHHGALPRRLQGPKELPQVQLGKRGPDHGSKRGPTGGG